VSLAAYYLLGVDIMLAQIVAVGPIASDGFNWSKDLLAPLATGIFGGLIVLFGQMILQNSGVWHSFSGQWWEVKVASYEKLFRSAFEAFLATSTLPDGRRNRFDQAYYDFVILRVGVLVTASEEVMKLSKDYQRQLGELGRHKKGEQVPQEEKLALVKSLRDLFFAIRDDLGIQRLSQAAKDLFESFPAQIIADNIGT
jgi:hypothetical protein